MFTLLVYRQGSTKPCEIYEIELFKNVLKTIKELEEDVKSGDIYKIEVIQ